MSIFGSNARVSKAVLDATTKILQGEQVEELDEMSSKEKMKKGLYNSKMDPVGQEDGDIDNDGDKDDSDKYLMKRRKAIKKAMKTDESNDVDTQNVDKALKHDCATHVEHAEYGIGRCVPGMHTLVQVDEETGVVTHYDVMFENDEGPYIVENINVAEMKVLKAMNHGHKKNK